MSTDLAALTPLQISAADKHKRSFVTGLTKAQIRSKILLKLTTQKEAERNKKSTAIKKKLFSLKIFKKAKTVMFYISFDGEVNTRKMIKAAYKLGKKILVPVCKTRSSIRPAILEEHAKLKKGLYGTCEPKTRKFMPLQKLDLVIVPAVAFDKQGSRLGRGKGCYDNFLKKLPSGTASIGLAFDFQILPDIPTTKRDISVDKVIFA